MKKKFTPVEDVLNIFDENRLWFYTPGFRGYEVSNDGYVRSMKHYRRYPYGILIKPVAREPYGSSCDPLYELSDDNNERKRIRLSQIMTLAKTSYYAVAGYPRKTIITDSGSRNKYVKNKNGAYVKVYNGPGNKKQMNIPPMDNTAHYVKFTVIQEGNEMPHMDYRAPEVRVPVSSIKGDKYYGREDCRTISGVNVCGGPSEVLYRGE